MKTLLVAPFAVVLVFVGHLAVALENGHNLVAEFESRVLPFEQKTAKHPGVGEAGFAYDDYEKFLNKELDQAYSSLLTKTNDDSKQDLIDAEKQWLQFRKSEVQFLQEEWTTKHFGTSATASRGAYGAALTKTRILTLLHYLQNYD